MPADVRAPASSPTAVLLTDVPPEWRVLANFLTQRLDALRKRLDALEDKIARRSDLAEIAAEGVAAARGTQVRAAPACFIQ